MDKQTPKWAEQLRISPIAQAHFTEESITSTLHKIKRQRRTSLRKLRAAWTLCFLLAAGGMFVALPYAVKQLPPQTTNNDLHTQAITELNFNIFPDGTFRAGRPFGYIFNFTTPFSELKGKTLSIETVHVATGQRLKAVLPQLITEPSSGYEGLERYTANITLPFGGNWRYEAKLDGYVGGQAELNVPEPLWDISPLFSSGEYLMRGTAGKIGFIDAGFVAGLPNKYMWHFWGSEEELNGDFQVKAVKQGTDRIIDVAHAALLGGPNNGADKHLPLSMVLEEAGRWRLLPFIGGKLADTIVIDVLEDKNR